MFPHRWGLTRTTLRLKNSPFTMENNYSASILRFSKIQPLKAHLEIKWTDSFNFCIHAVVSGSHGSQSLFFSSLSSVDSLAGKIRRIYLPAGNRVCKRAGTEDTDVSNLGKTQCPALAERGWWIPCISLIFNFLKNSCASFHTAVVFSLMVYETILYFLPTLKFYLFGIIQPNRCEVVSHSGFNFYFPDS